MPFRLLRSLIVAASLFVGSLAPAFAQGEIEPLGEPVASSTSIPEPTVVGLIAAVGGDDDSAWTSATLA